ncbi:MAG: peptidylprolyl isomerase [Planctomycetes bacterium]|nr:peptidylprolyl isomerase [Planctomycetota bacterium]
MDRAVTLDPDDVGVRDSRSRLRELLGDLDGAAEDLDRILRAKPDRAAFFVRRANLDRRRNRYEEARRRLAPFVAKDAAAQAEDGLCAFALDDYAAAVERLEAASKSKDALPASLRSEVEATLALARERVKHWDEERKLRDAEAKKDDLPRARLVTSAGEVEIELFENEAPVAVANFVALAERKFFDGTRFHRVIPNFMAQGGDPNSRNDDPSDDGQGGPGYSFKDELPAGRFRRHFRGSLSMANSGPDTNGSQFFVTHLPTPWLDGKHVVFGRVVKGMEVVDKIRGGDALVQVEILRKRDHPYKTPQ